MEVPFYTQTLHLSLGKLGKDAVTRRHIQEICQERNDK